MTTTLTDHIQRPSHYTQGEIECIDAMLAAHGPAAVKNYCVCAAFKYLWRHNHKGHSQDDLKKAVWYLRFAAGDDPRLDPLPPIIPVEKGHVAFVDDD